MFKHLSVRSVLEKIKQSENVLILVHTNPDGDAIGSAVSLANLVESLSGKAQCLSPDPVSQRLRFVCDRYDFEPDELRDRTDGSFFEKYDLICSVDVASPKQLGRFSFLADEKRIDFMIDHHKSGTPFADNLIVTDAAASGEIVFSLFSEATILYGVSFDSGSARAIYSSIVSDTGGFQYSNTTKQTHEITSKLIRQINETDGLSTSEICRKLLEETDIAHLKASRIAIDNIRLFAEGKLALTMIKKDDALKEEICEADTSSIVNIPRSIEGVHVAVAIKQSLSDPDTFRISARSNSECNVAKICAKLGGGGHDRAAGATITASDPDEAFTFVKEQFMKLFL